MSGPNPYIKNKGHWPTCPLPDVKEQCMNTKIFSKYIACHIQTNSFIHDYMHWTLNCWSLKAPFLLYPPLSFGDVQVI